jgi:hypothetical protein
LIREKLEKEKRGKSVLSVNKILEKSSRHLMTIFTKD